MEKRIITVLFIAIGVSLAFTVRWIQVRRGTAKAMTEVMEEARSINPIAVIAAAQNHFRKSVARDEDGDGIGEYGTMADLFGADKSKTSTIRLTVDKYCKSHPGCDALLDEQPVAADGTLRAGDYLYSIFLPDTIDGRERNWCVFAHPQKDSDQSYKTYLLDGRSPDRVYFTVHDGYAGPGSGPTPSMAYEDTPFEGRIRAIPFPADDGNGEEGVREAIAKFRRSKGALWTSVPIVYPPGCPVEQAR